MHTVPKNYHFLKEHNWRSHIFSIPVLACNIGTYGEGCREECGYCHNTTGCYHVNGSCLYECQPGYTGTQCKTSRLRVWNPSRKAMFMLYYNIGQDPLNIYLSRQHWLTKKKMIAAPVDASKTSKCTILMFHFSTWKKCYCDDNSV